MNRIVAAIGILLSTASLPAAVTMVSTVAGVPGVAGVRDGQAGSALFNKPTAMTVDRESGDLYVVDRLNERVRRVGVDGVVTTLAVALDGFDFGGAAGGGIAQYETIRAGTVPFSNYSRSLFVSDTGRHRILRIAADGVREEAGLRDQPGSSDGNYLSALFRSPTQMVLVGQYGLAYVCDTGNHVIRRMVRVIGFGGDDGYDIYTLAGTPGVAGSADGVGPSASFNAPRGIAIGADGTLYVADSGNHTIRKISPAGEVTTLAGRAGVAGWLNGPRDAALLNFPTGIALDPSGSLYVCDTGNSVIREVFPDGTVTTIAGVPGLAGHADGVAGQALFNGPVGIVDTGSGVLFVSDTSNHVIRRIDLAPQVPRRRPAKK